MTASLQLSAQDWNQKAGLLLQVANKLVSDANPQKCRVGFPLISQIFRELLSNAESGNMEALCRCYTNLYFVAWRGCEELESLNSFADEVSKPFSAFVRNKLGFREQQDFAVTKTGVGQFKLAYIASCSKLWTANAIARTAFTLWIGHTELREDLPKLTVYLLQEPDAEYLDWLDKIDAEVVDLSTQTNSFDKARLIVEDARAKEIKALVCDEPGPIQTMVFAQRAAPIQGLAEMGFAPWGVDGADICFAGVTQDPDVLQHSCKMSVRTKRGIAGPLLDIPVDPEHTSALRRDLVKNVTSLEVDGQVRDPVVYGTYSRLSKFTPEYLKRAEAILKAAENSILFIGGTGNTSLIDEFIKNSGVGSRVAFVPNYVNGYLVSSAIDVFLDTDPFPGGVSCDECQVKGVPVVWRKSYSKDNFAILETHRDAELMASNDEEYITNALSLNDPATLKRASERARKVAEGVTNCKEMALDIEVALAEQLNLLCQMQSEA